MINLLQVPSISPTTLTELIAEFNDICSIEDDTGPPRPWPAEREVLMNKIEELEGELGIRADIPPVLGIPRNMGRLLAMLMKREVITRDGALLAIYSGMPNTWDKDPDPKIIDVFICKLRVRLRKYGVKVSCKWGLGYFIDGENKRKLRDLIAKSRAVAE